MDSSISAELLKGVTTRSAAETRELAATFAKTLPADTVIALHGDMGVGKTTFVQGLARGLGVTDQVTSPTFAIYSIHRGAKCSLIHVDAYRLESGRQIEELLLEEFLVSPYCVAVEWPERIDAWLPANALHLELSIVDDRHHRIAAKKPAK